MKRRLPLMASFAIICLCWLLPTDHLQAQSYFSLTDITILPGTPNNYDQVSVSLSGTMADSCTYLDFFDAEIVLYSLNIQMDWDSAANPICNGAMIPWDTIIQLGALPVGTYEITLLGSNYTNDSGSSLSFEVSELPIGTCGNNGIVWVTNTNDTGSGSLRAAINCANLNTDINQIQFDIPGGGFHIIKVGETTGLPLPVITEENVIIDGTTQPGFGTDGPLVFLDGSFNQWNGIVSGLHIQGDDCGVYGLDISKFPDNGILIDGALSADIGAPDMGNNIHSNGLNTTIPNIPINYTVGAGIRLINGANACFISGNYIGTNDPAGEVLGNGFCGILLQNECDANTIGGLTMAEGNIIANNPNGIRIEATSDFNEIIHNVFECNDSIAIKLIGNANTSQAAPIITEINYQEVKGFAVAGHRVDVYTVHESCIGAPCQGRTFLGSAVVDVVNEWELVAPFANGDTLLGGDVITAIATSTNGSSSEFANCGVVTGVSHCTDPAGIIWVTNAQDTGIGSLREAMICADTTLGANKIHFDIPGTGPFTIDVGSVFGTPLPLITDRGTVLDATTQPGYGGGGNFTPQIILSGLQNNWNTPDEALKITGDYTEIYGLQINAFPDNAIEVLNAVHVTIGAKDKGNVIYNNGSSVDFFPGLPGQGPFEGSGISLHGTTTRTSIIDNIIGTDYTQTSTAGNEYCGIFLDYNIDFVTIGGPGKGNIIANNAEGVRVGDESFGISIRQNSFYCNDTVAIRLNGVASGEQLPPEWDDTNSTSLTMLSGQADAGDAFVEIFRVDNAACSSAPCQGKTYLGRAFVNNNLWILNAPFANGITLSNGDLITATAIDENANTSEFSECHIAANCTLNASTGSKINATCNEANGSFTIASSGGPAPYIYDRGLGEQASATFTGLAAGTYTVTVTDAYTCYTTTTVTITDPGLPSTSIQSQGAETCDMQNGFLIMNQASGGTSPYSFNIGFGNQFNNPNFINLAADDYTVTVTDANGCTGETPVTIAFVTAPTLSIINVEDETCGGANGAFTADATMGTPLYSYDIGTGGQLSPDFSGLPGGSYTVTVTDDNGCTDTEPVTFVDIPGPSALNVDDITGDFCGQSNGTVTVSPVGGTADFLYDIGFGGDASNTFFDLPADIYVVTVTDINQCTATANVTIPAIDGPTLSIGSSSDANCGQATGALTISATGGMSPYVYNIGNGNQSGSTFNNLLAGSYMVTVTDANNCTTVQDATINDIGAPTPSISAMTNASCEGANGSFTIAATGGESPYLYNIGGGITGNPTFSNVAAGSYSVTVTDAANCSSVLPVELPNDGLLAIADFTFVENDGTVTFTNTSMNAGSYNWDFGDNGMSSAPDPVHTFATNGDFNVCLSAINDCGTITSCQTVSILVQVNISGTITKENGQLVSNVILNTAPTNPVTNNADGTYMIGNLTANENYEVVPEKDINYGNGVSTFDVFKIQQHILFTSLLDSPYKIIAADVNHSNGVSTFDTYLMQQVILHNVDTFPNNTSWRFVPAEYVFPDSTNPFINVFPESIFFNGLNMDEVDQDFIAIKIGDVNLNADPTMIMEPPSDKMRIGLNDSALKTGKEVKVAFTTKSTQQLAGLQFDIVFDPQALDFVEVQSGELAGLDYNDFNIQKAADGKIAVAWYDKDGMGQIVDENKVLFYLTFKAKENGMMHDFLSLESFQNTNRAYQPDGYAMEVQSLFEKEEEVPHLVSDYKLSVQPNPFTSYVDVLLEMPVAEKGVLSLYDMAGQLVYSKSALFEKGVQQFRLNSDEFPAKGLYMLQLRTEGFVQSLRLVAE